MIDDPDKTQEWVIDDVAELLRRINECEKRYQTLIETNLYGVQVINIHGKITYINAVQSDVLGYPSTELEGKDIWKILATEYDRKALTDYLTKLAKEDFAPHYWSGKFLNYKGKIIQLKMIWNCMRNEQGNVTGFISFTSGINEKKPDKEISSEKCEEYRLIVESAREMILTFDMKGKITYINEKGTEIIGYFKEEMLDMNIADILPPVHLEKIKEKLLDKEKIRLKEGIYYQLEFITRNLNLLPMDISASLIIKENEPSGILIIARNLGRQKRDERELIKNCKFDTITTFSNGIIYDLNDFLTGILGNIDFAQLNSEPDGKIYKQLDDAKKICIELKVLLRQMDELSHNEILNKETGKLAKLVQNLVNQKFTDLKIAMDFPPPDDEWFAEFDSMRIQQLMEILLVNAKEAMQSGGEIRIDVKNITVSPEREKAGLPMKPGKYVKISVQDQGTGIPRENLEKIFDPYFTTKKTDVKKGTGLGLTIAYAIVKKHNGYMYVDSKPGIGTVIHVCLPASVKEQEQTQKKKDAPVFKGNILVMDDEDVVRDITGQMLRKLGYGFYPAKNGEEALDIYQKAVASGKSFDAVILDLHVANGMGGRDIIKKMLIIDPGVKGIVSSGYSNDPEMRDFGKYGFCGTLEKPYSIRDLNEILNRLIILKKEKTS